MRNKKLQIHAYTHEYRARNLLKLLANTTTSLTRGKHCTHWREGERRSAWLSAGVCSRVLSALPPLRGPSRHAGHLTIRGPAVCLSVCLHCPRDTEAHRVISHSIEHDCSFGSVNHCALTTVLLRHPLNSSGMTKMLSIFNDIIKGGGYICPTKQKRGIRISKVSYNWKIFLILNIPIPSSSTRAVRRLFQVGRSHHSIHKKYLWSCISSVLNKLWGVLYV